MFVKLHKAVYAIKSHDVQFQTKKKHQVLGRLSRRGENKTSNLKLCLYTGDPCEGFEVALTQ